MFKCLVFIINIVLAFGVIASTSTGSGVFVNSNILVTAYHVVNGAENIEVFYFNSRMLSGHIVSSDKVKDYAVVEVNGTVSDYVEVNPSRCVYMGDKVYVLGYPATAILGNNVKYTEGVISAIGFANDDDIIQMTAPIQPGNSGGPVFAADGSLIGIVTASIQPEKFYKLTGGALPQNLNFALDINAISEKEKKWLGPSTIPKERRISQNQRVTCFIKCEKRNDVTVKVGQTLIPPQILKMRPKPSRKVIPSLSLGEGEIVIDSLFGYKLGDTVADVEVNGYGSGTQRVVYCTKEVPIPAGIDDFRSLKLFCTPITHKIYRIIASVKFSGKRQLFQICHPLEEKARSLADKYRKLYSEKYNVYFTYESPNTDRCYISGDIYTDYCTLQCNKYVAYPDYYKTGQKIPECEFTISAIRKDSQKVPIHLIESQQGGMVDISFAKAKARHMGYEPKFCCEVVVTLSSGKIEAIRAKENFELIKPERDKAEAIRKQENERRSRYMELL